jgi:hypothetical protein
VSESLKSDHAARLTRRIVARFNWDHESQLAEAYRELLPVVRHGLDEFERKLNHRATRLRPLGPTTPEEATDAPE